MFDQNGDHRSEAESWPDSIQPLRVLAYSPKLNPVERIFQEVRARLADRLFADLIELDAAITNVLRGYWTVTVRLAQPTGFQWCRERREHSAISIAKWYE